MNISLIISCSEADLILNALINERVRTNTLALDEIINTVDASLFSAAMHGDRDDEGDQFRTDAEADGDALASAGHGTDEDYGGGCEDAGLEFYHED
jgi:hypothetical protein